jgi:lipoyl(octanoyl) transferase
MFSNTIEVLQLGKQDYQTSYDAMRLYTQNRDQFSPDQIWVVEHPPVYTLGQAGEMHHLLDTNTPIPIVKVDRGGQITYHGPGQIVIYLLINLKRQNLFVREFVHKIEQAIIETLISYGVYTERIPGAPGIYLNGQNSGFEHLKGAKIAALGLKITKQCSYHGLSLNVDMDLSPFKGINPCGYQGLQTIDLATLNKKLTVKEVSDTLVIHLKNQLEKLPNNV